jgi:hypothetical protein
MKPDKTKWIAAIAKIMHEYPVIVAILDTPPIVDQIYAHVELRLAKVGKHYLLGRYDEQFDDDYKWTDSIEEVKKAMSNLAGEESDGEELSGWQDPKLVDSIKDSAPLFGEGWDPDDIVREIDADENFRIRILDADGEIEEEYEEF